MSSRVYTQRGLLHQWTRRNPRVVNTSVTVERCDGRPVTGHVDFKKCYTRDSLIEMVVTHPHTRVLLYRCTVEARGYR